MKRRKILGAMGVLGIPGLSGATSFYGTPVSVAGPKLRSTQPLRLLLSEVDISADIMPLMMAFGTVWERVLGDEGDRTSFQRDPTGFLSRYGIPKTVLDARDQEVVLLLALTDPVILESSLSGNYKNFLKRLRKLGITSQTATKSGLKRQVLSILEKNLIDLQVKTTILDDNSTEKSIPYTGGSQELMSLYGQLAPSIEQGVAVAVPVAIAAIAAVYISVGAVVTVSILSGVYVSVAVATAITVSGQGFDGERSRLFADPVSDPIGDRTERQRIMEHAIVQRELLGKRMLMLSPERLQEAQQTARLARLLNKKAFVLEANRRLVKDEVVIFFEAAEELGLINVQNSVRENMIESIQKIALRAAALD